MTEHQTMNTIVHAAVRRDLDRFAGALRGFPAGSRPRAAQLMAAWKNFYRQLDEHHHHEETIFWPALRELGADESLVGDLGGEHERMLDELKVVDGAMTSLVADPSAGRAQQTLSAVNDLKAAVETHFAHEERDLEPFMAERVETEPMKRAVKQVQRANGLRDSGVFMAWLQDGADPDDRAALAQVIPKPVLFMLTRVFGRSYSRDIAPVWG